MKFLCDSALIHAKDVFSDYGEVVLKPGREICADDMTDIDVLIVRSVTKVNEELLKSANAIKFVGTATAGEDHIDTAYLKERGIAYSNAKGANAVSVADYVLSVLLVLAQRYDFSFEGKSIGIIGCGRVGSEVEKKALGLGLNVVKCDPPRYASGDLSCSASYAQALSCDIVTLHVPLNNGGTDNTYHMIGYKELMSLKKDCVFINASRGPVVNSLELYAVLTQRPDLKVWLDVFEGEPEIECKELLNYVDGATAHIAGYSFESKLRACVMLAKEMASVLNLEIKESFQMPGCEIAALALDNVSVLDLDLISRLVFSVYDVRRDGYKFQANFTGAKSFDEMRKNYRERRELSSVQIANAPEEFVNKLSLLGFNVLTQAQVIQNLESAMENLSNSK